jgi:hypothetical protein
LSIRTDPKGQTVRIADGTYTGGWDARETAADRKWWQEVGQYRVGLPLLADAPSTPIDEDMWSLGYGTLEVSR